MNTPATPTIIAPTETWFRDQLADNWPGPHDRHALYSAVGGMFCAFEHNVTDPNCKTLHDQLAIIAKLERFKLYVHNRLDAAGIPANPDPAKVAKTGCRIGARFDHALGPCGLSYAAIMARTPDTIATPAEEPAYSPAWRAIIDQFQELGKTPGDLQTWCDQHCASCSKLITDGRQTEDGDCLPCVGRVAIPCETCNHTGRVITTDGADKPCAACDGFGESWEPLTVTLAQPAALVGPDEIRMDTPDMHPTEDLERVPDELAGGG